MVIKLRGHLSLPASGLDCDAHQLVIASAIVPPRTAPTFLFIEGTELNMRGILLWVLGIPIPVIILLYLFHVI